MLKSTKELKKGLKIRVGELVKQKGELSPELTKIPQNDSGLVETRNIPKLLLCSSSMHKQKKNINLMANQHD